MVPVHFRSRMSPTGLKIYTETEDEYGDMLSSAVKEVVPRLPAFMFITIAASRRGWSPKAASEQMRYSLWACTLSFRMSTLRMSMTHLKKMASLRGDWPWSKRRDAGCPP